MKPCILTVTLNPAIDKTVTVPHFCLGRDFREEALSVSAGGKGINVSRVLKHLGIDTVASGFLGGPNGVYIREQLKRERIKQNFSSIKQNTRISLTILEPHSKVITRILERGPEVSNSEIAAFRKNYTKLLKRSSLAVLSGRNALGAPDSLYAGLIRIALAQAVPVLLDASGKAYGLGLAAKPWMIKPNLKEAEAILEKRLTSLKKIREAALAFRKRGISLVAISMGSRGALVYDGKNMFLARPPAVRTKSPVGCGDAFNAGFLAAFVRKQNIACCLRLAVACGAANALSINPGFIKAALRKRIYKQVCVRRLT